MAVAVPSSTFDRDKIGQSIPPDTAHAVSVSLPTWKACVGYEEGEEWVLSKMKSAYPRFFVDSKIRALEDALLKDFAHPEERAILFPSIVIASRCIHFLARGNALTTSTTAEVASSKDVSAQAQGTRLVNLVFRLDNTATIIGQNRSLASAVIFQKGSAQAAKIFWQHTGDGISSRRAEFCHELYQKGYLEVQAIAVVDGSTPLTSRGRRGPRRYQRADANTNSSVTLADLCNGGTSFSSISEDQEFSQYIEERYGRNLTLQQAENAKLAIRRRIAGSLLDNLELPEAMARSANSSVARNVGGFTVDDVYLYPSGMSSIFNTHQNLLAARSSLKSVSYGFPYIDTLKILQKWGPGCLFYGHGSLDELDDLELRCCKGETFLALFCEFPGNPLLKSPDLRRIRSLADRHNFAVVIDETIGNFMNVHVLPYADVVVSSLTKVFSGDSNVMGGSAILNPEGRYYTRLKDVLDSHYEDSYWAEDALFMERNSRDFVTRISRINQNAAAVCTVLKESSYIKEVHYPEFAPTRNNYDACRRPGGGYGGLFSVTFFSTEAAVMFFDAIEIAKGPSLGTNFTLCSPYTLLAHYNELEWAAGYGVEADLVRFSVGLENMGELVAKFKRALEVLEKSMERK